MTARELPELLPCPFCLNQTPAVFPPTCNQRTPYNAADRAFPIVRCGCGASKSGKDWDQSGLSAIEAWNTRAAPRVSEGMEALLFSGEWVVSSMVNNTMLKEEVSERMRWRAERGKPPFCNKDGASIWFGKTWQEAVAAGEAALAQRGKEEHREPGDE